MKFSVKQLTAACAIALLANNVHALTSVAPGGSLGTLTEVEVDFYGLAGVPNSYTFNLAQNSRVDGDIDAFFAFTLTSLDISGTVISAASNGSFSMPFLAAGNYALTVLGSGLGYTGTISATAVPEANSVALALAGLSVAGICLARRKKQA